MPDLEAVGDVATGTVIGRAVEPRAGEARDGHTQESKCLNCGCELTGPFCHCCGQKAHVHRTLGAFWHDLLHGVLHFEGKIWRTLPLLAWKPGALTRRYIDGERARFVSPIALFLFSVFLTFAVVGATGAFQTGNDLRVEGDLSEAVQNASAKVVKLEAERARTSPASSDRQTAERRLSEAKRELEALQLVTGRNLAGTRLRFADGVPDWLRNSVEKAAKNPELLFYKLKTNAYKFSWALIPLSVPFMWLLFPFSRRFRLYDHTIFVTYSLCFMTLLLVVAILAASAGAPGVTTAMVLLAPPFHIYRQLKDTYELGRFGALWRTVFLIIFALTAVGLFLLLLVTLGLFD